MPKKGWICKLVPKNSETFHTGDKLTSVFHQENWLQILSKLIVTKLATIVSFTTLINSDSFDIILTDYNLLFHSLNAGMFILCLTVQKFISNF